ncbi:hypothetical protein MWU38_00195 [Qipengyuania sp. S6317L1]|uniref:hypothetical protein n=1 Tax=Qipengyuania sp. S6317L1 TaxID=2926410 RepID=UPI001FF4ADA5|nr:hypothetical protein [Qipengyuania sp. S6317L1]MCK0097789.1 hypothetical protein [Qipengyuania sp. S6317L1]
MIALVAIWAFAEAVLFFIVADVPIMALGIRSGVRKAMLAALVAAVSAALGGAALWLWASTHPKDVIELMLVLPGIDAALVAQTHDDWALGGMIAMTIGSFSGVPYKLYALAAGSTGAGTGALALFALASIIARLPRFVLVALVAGWAGPRMVQRFGKRPVWTAFFMGWAAFYALYWSAMGF